MRNLKNIGYILLGTVRKWYSLFGFKVFNQIGNHPCFQLVEEKKCVASEYAKEVWELVQSLSALVLLHTFVGDHFKQTKKIFSFSWRWPKECIGDFCFKKVIPCQRSAKNYWRIFFTSLMEAAQLIILVTR